MDHTNQKGTLVSPGAHWFPQAHTIVRITPTNKPGIKTSSSTSLSKYLVFLMQPPIPLLIIFTHCRLPAQRARDRTRKQRANI